MKYIFGNTSREYSINGITTPRSRYTDEELAKGKRIYVGVTDEQYEELLQEPIFKQLINNHSLVLKDAPPSEPLADAQAMIASLQLELEHAKSLGSDDTVHLQTQIEQLISEAAAKDQQIEELTTSLNKAQNTDSELAANIAKYKEAVIQATEYLLNDEPDITDALMVLQTVYNG
jgi:hypothetical protein